MVWDSKGWVTWPPGRCGSTSSFRAEDTMLDSPKQKRINCWCLQVTTGLCCRLRKCLTELVSASSFSLCVNYPLVVSPETMLICWNYVCAHCCLWQILKQHWNNLSLWNCCLVSALAKTELWINNISAKIVICISIYTTSVLIWVRFRTLLQSTLVVHPEHLNGCMHQGLSAYPLPLSLSQMTVHFEFFRPLCNC